MVIVTWNANRVNRWDLLMKDPDFKRPWDVICLQETGNPPANWAQLDGAAFGTKQERATDESTCRRGYEWTCPSGKFYATHSEWPNQQKNHFVMMTRNRPRFRNDIGGGTIRRPVPALKARVKRVVSVQRDPRTRRFRLTWEVKFVLIGTVHFQPFTAAKEFADVLQWITAAAAVFQMDAWILVGDFNMEPKVAQDVLDRSPFVLGMEAVVRAPTWPTHSSGHRYDYIAASAAWAVGPDGDRYWRPGNDPDRAASDHTLQVYDGGPFSPQLVGFE